MIYILLKSYISQYHIANLFHYISFRSILAMLFSFGLSVIFGQKVISRIKRWNESGQPIREIGPDHQIKAGTPTMGGIMILLAVLITCFIFSDLSNPYIYLVLWVLFGYGFLGLADDYLKVSKKNHHGVSPKFKMVLQLAIALPACCILSYLSSPSYSTILSFPFFKNLSIDLGFFYIPFATFVIIGSSNAVNLTDGLDGLAIVPICIVASCFALICYLVGNGIYAEYLQFTYIPKIAELAVLCAAIIGAGMGFLWYNAQPAEIFMGDTGSLALGGALGILSVISKHEFVLAIAGGIFVIETISVIIQVYYFKYTSGKRFFKMAPIHHHFEKSGWTENKVVIRFWILSVIFALIALSSLKLR